MHQSTTLVFAVVLVLIQFRKTPGLTSKPPRCSCENQVARLEHVVDKMVGDMKKLKEKIHDTELNEENKNIMRLKEELDYMKSEIYSVRVQLLARTRATQAISSSQASKLRLNGNNTVAFFVRKTSPVGVAPGPYNIIWDHLVTSVGCCWNHQVGQFIPVVKGLYVFHVAIYSTSTHSSYVIIKKNDETALAVYASMFTSAYYFQSSGQAVLLLEPFDTIVVQLQSGFGLFSSSTRMAHFSGYLLTELP